MASFSEPLIEIVSIFCLYLNFYKNASVISLRLNVKFISLVAVLMNIVWLGSVRKWVLDFPLPPLLFCCCQYGWHFRHAYLRFSRHFSTLAPWNFLTRGEGWKMSLSGKVISLPSIFTPCLTMQIFSNLPETKNRQTCKTCNNFQYWPKK